MQQLEIDKKGDTYYAEKYKKEIKMPEDLEIEE